MEVSARISAGILVGNCFFNPSINALNCARLVINAFYLPGKRPLLARLFMSSHIRRSTVWKLIDLPSRYYYRSLLRGLARTQILYDYGFHVPGNYWLRNVRGVRHPQESYCRVCCSLWNISILWRVWSRWVYSSTSAGIDNRLMRRPGNNLQALFAL